MNKEEVVLRAKEFFKEIVFDEDIQRYLLVLKKHHKETYYHSRRVGLMCCKMGILNELTLDELKLITLSGIFHDMGKLYIPTKILNLKRKLNESERKIIQEHSRNGFLKLRGMNFERVAKLIITHHECKLESYPRKNKEETYCRVGEERRKNKLDPRLKDILAISDFYSSLKYKRAYKTALKKDEIERILKKEFLGDKIYIAQALRF